MGNGTLDLDTVELTSTWGTFGYKYRGRWVPTNAYRPKDVVWMDIVPEPKEGTETYFICKEGHIAKDENEIINESLWEMCELSTIKVQFQGGCCWQQPPFPTIDIK